MRRGACGVTGVVCGGCVGGLAAGSGAGEDSARTATTTAAAAATAPAKTIVVRHGSANAAPVAPAVGGDELLLEDVDEVGHCSWLLMRARNAASPRETRWRAAGSEIDCAAAISS